VEVLVGLLGLVTANKEAERIERSLRKLDKDIGTLQKRLDNRAFVEKAPPEVVAEARGQLAALERQKGRLEEARKLIDELGDDDDDDDE
jgi:valyl-tRNA synthetase